MVVVSPREVADLTYRAARVNGVGSGEARHIANAVLFAEVQLTGALDTVVERLAAGRVPALGLAPLAQIESAVVRDGSARIEPADELTVADLAEPAYRASRRGVLVSFECGDGETYSLGDYLRVGRAGLDISALIARTGSVEPGVGIRVAERDSLAHRNGIDLDTATWTSLVDVAAGYLIAEATLDSGDES